MNGGEYVTFLYSVSFPSVKISITEGSMVHWRFALNKVLLLNYANQRGLCFSKIEIESLQCNINVYQNEIELNSVQLFNKLTFPAVALNLLVTLSLLKKENGWHWWCVEKYLLLCRLLNFVFSPENTGRTQCRHNLFLQKDMRIGKQTNQKCSCFLLPFYCTPIKTLKNLILRLCQKNILLLTWVAAANGAQQNI